MLAGELGERVNLKGEIPSAHGVEKVEADRKLRPEAPINRFAEQGARLVEDNVDGGNFDPRATGKFKQQRIFFRNTIKAPGVVRRPVRKGANFAHPLPAPRTGIKKRHDAKRAVCGGGDPGKMSGPADELWLVRDGGVEEKIPLRQGGLLQPILALIHI